jgi:hypothetical protein
MSFMEMMLIPPHEKWGKKIKEDMGNPKKLLSTN